MIYIIDRESNHLFRVNPTTLAVTDVGSLGINTDYAQGLDFEEESGLLYWAAYNSIEDHGELRVIDMATGESTLIGPFPEGKNVTVLAFATGGPVDWLSFVPGGDTLDPGGNATVTVTVDPSMLDQPGIYDAALMVKHDSLYTYDPIPVRLALNGEAPIITSLEGTTFIVGEPTSVFTIESTGFPTPTLGFVGDLPDGVSFTDHLDGTATISDTPLQGSGGVYDLTITASNGVEPDDDQLFPLTVNEAPSITSLETANFNVEKEGVFTIRTWGYPIPDLEVVGVLPDGFIISYGNGTAELSGIPSEGQQGEYPLTITARNTSGPDATQDFTLKVIDAIETDFTVFLPLITR